MALLGASSLFLARLKLACLHVLNNTGWLGCE